MNAIRKELKHALVKRHLERISSRAFNAYRNQIADLIGQTHGIYALYKANHLYYVGLANDLKRRIKHHLKDRHAKRWDRFSLYLIEKAAHIKEIESLVLRIASPRGNKQAGKLPGSYSMIKDLDKMVKEYQTTQRLSLIWDEKPVCEDEGNRLKKLDSIRKKGPVALKGYFKRSKRIRKVYKGVKYTAIIRPSGRILLNKQLYNTPSGAAVTITNKPVDGWHFWNYKNSKGEWVQIDQLRK